MIKNVIMLIKKKIEGIHKLDKTPLANFISKENSDLAYIYNII